MRASALPFNDVPRPQKSNNDECLKAYASTQMVKLRSLRTLRGFIVVSSLHGRIVNATRRILLSTTFNALWREFEFWRWRRSHARLLNQHVASPRR